jgi:hypothetical protein
MQICGAHLPARWSSIQVAGITASNSRIRPTSRVQISERHVRCTRLANNYLRSRIEYCSCDYLDTLGILIRPIAMASKPKKVGLVRISFVAATTDCPAGFGAEETFSKVPET